MARLRPDDLDADLTFVKARLAERDLQGAYDRLDALVRRHPENQLLRLSLAYLLVAVGELEAAVDVLGGGLDLNPGPALYRELGDVLGRLGRHADAANAFRMLRAVDPGDRLAQARLDLQELLAAHSATR